MELILFLSILALLMIHEMDAIRSKEWNMFIILKDMAEEKAYWVFTIIHMPLYLLVFLTLAGGGDLSNFRLKIIIDIFVICHAIIHYCFRKHKKNEFQSVISKIIIYLMSVLAILHLLVLIML